MTVEIGSLVVRGSFGAETSNEYDRDEIEELLEVLRREILEDVRDMIAEARRRDSEG